MATKEGRDLKNKRDEENKFNLEIDLEKNEDINLEDQKEE
jgi:hypothetical protein